MLGMYQENGIFLFKHLSGLMKLTLKGVPVGISKLVVSSEGENAKGISGQAIVKDIKEKNAILTLVENSSNTITINVDTKEITDKTFYIPLPVGEYSQLSVSYSTKDSVYYENTLADCIIKRGVITDIPEVTILNENEVVKEYMQTIDNYISDLFKDNKNNIKLVQDSLVSWLKQQSYVSKLEYDDNKEYITLTYPNGLQSMVSFIYAENTVNKENIKESTRGITNKQLVYNIASVDGEEIAIAGPVLYLNGMKLDYTEYKYEFYANNKMIEESPVDTKMEESIDDIYVLNRLGNYSAILIAQTHGGQNGQGGFGIRCKDENQFEFLKQYKEKVIPNSVYLIAQGDVKFYNSFFIFPKFFDNYQWTSTHFIYGNYCWSHELGKHVVPSFCGYVCRTWTINNLFMSQQYFESLFNGLNHEDAVENVDIREFVPMLPDWIKDWYSDWGHICKLRTSNKHKKQRYFSITTNPIEHLSETYCGVKVTGKFNGYKNLKKEGIQYGIFYRIKDNDDFNPVGTTVQFATFGNFTSPKPMDSEGNLTLSILNLIPNTEYQFALGFKYGGKSYYGNVCEYKTGVEVDREALIDFYQQADGDNWDINAKKNWCTDKPISEWANVKTSIIDGDMKVTELTFPTLPEKVESINLQKLDKLISVDINGAKLKNLNISGHTSLKCILDNAGDGMIDNLNLANCTSYTNQHGWGTPFKYGKNNNLSGCISLSGGWDGFSVYEHIETLNLSGCTALDFLSGRADKLRGLDVSGCINLKSLKLRATDNNKIALNKINLSGCTELKELSCAQGELTELDVSSCSKIEIINCWNNELKSIKLGNLPMLQELRCYGNKLKSLNLSQCASLQVLYCAWNQLTALNVSALGKLRVLGCDHNQLTSIDLSNNYNLERLDCTENKITTLDLSKMVSDRCRVKAHGNNIKLVIFRSRVHKASNVNNFTLWGNYSSKGDYYNSINRYYEYPQYKCAN